MNSYLRRNSTMSDQSANGIDQGYIKEDGITHINIHPRGKTRLGRLLHMDSDIHVETATHGRFRTAAGYYLYLITGCNDDSFRSRTAADARIHAKTMPRVWNKDMRECFIEALRGKVSHHKELRELYLNNPLPYVSYNPRARTARLKGKGDWIISLITHLYLYTDDTTQSSTGDPTP